MPETTPPRAASPDREAVASALLGADPGAPTLCEGWTTRDLAVHLVLRDARPDVLAGELAAKVVPQLGAAAAQVRSQLEALPFPELVERLRSGPPSWSPVRLAPVEAAANGVEFYVHGEDVRRAAPGWTPEAPGAATSLRPGQREKLWRDVRLGARLFYRRSPVGVILVVPAGPRAVVKRGSVSVVLTGQPEELLLHAYGRRTVAQVEVGGPPDAVEAFEAVFPSTR